MRRSTLLIHHYGGQNSYYSSTSSDPVAEADRLTSLADARTALCIERGTALDDIDPASGYDRSRGAYDSCRQSWVNQIKVHGYSSQWDEPGLARAIANWTAHRPDFITGDDWLADAEKAHLAYWEQVGIPCTRPGLSCDLHPA